MAASATEKTLTGVGNLIRLLPTGTVFLFQFLSPILTNSGQCEPINKSLSLILILFCGLSCFLSSFTDSYTGDDGALHWGFATASGMWPSPESKKEDLSPYKLRAGDFVLPPVVGAVSSVVFVMFPNTRHGIGYYDSSATPGGANSPLVRRGA
ncbi:Protein DMP2, partial [Cucurbita argyrosperma subsp. sororia]